MNLTRREFVASGVAAAPRNTKILNYNPNMEYRRLGKTGLMVSAVSLGGHWKRVATMMPPGFKGAGYDKSDDQNVNNSLFLKNRDEVLTHCIESGINYVDACSPQEILAYAKVVKSKRDKIYFGFSWHTREPRFKEWRDPKKLMQGFDQGLKEAGLDYIDVWRISLPMEGIADLGELKWVEESTVAALDLARQQGKARFTGVSSHNRIWLKSVIQEYPKQIQVVLFPYTANSKELPDDSVFEAVRKHDVGVFGIKPFADNSLFLGDSSLNHAEAAGDDSRARMAIRYILSNPAISAAIPGLVNTHQVDNVALAVRERRKLDRREKAELDDAGRRMWANLRPGHEWLRNWEYV
jgi:predicted aldo/keto reductase-like oxidoreductase